MNKLHLSIIGVIIILGIIGLIALLIRDNKPESATEIAKASAEFKADQYFRYEPAKKLAPRLKIGMTAQDVEALLGKPNKKSNNDLLWYYTLGYSQFISVHFDSNGVVQKFGGAHAHLQSEETGGKREHQTDTQ
ncbi:MAG TPA: outer membrane protein assembly factor BamE [Sedimentisphaerales bacterium]|nr:outer membrane protein assembly factor BamE [Sedimentisphaerales bacterium]